MQTFAWKSCMCKDSESFPGGQMAPGAKARICAPGLRRRVKKGVIGELHQCVGQLMANTLTVAMMLGALH